MSTTSPGSINRVPVPEYLVQEDELSKTIFGWEFAGLLIRIMRAIAPINIVIKRCVLKPEIADFSIKAP